MPAGEAIRARRSVRAFSSQAVPRAVIEDILTTASRSPSGSNVQPWRVYVLQGASRDALVHKVRAAHESIWEDPARAADYPREYTYYPEKWKSPYIDRRRQNGFALYGLLGIGRGDKQAMHAQHQRNFCFFDAPVGLMFTIDRELEMGSMLDYGMFLQSIMVAAQARGLATCPQAAWNNFGSIVLPHIGAGPMEMLVCGMALGYEDTHALVNRLETPREPASAFTTWLYDEPSTPA